MKKVDISLSNILSSKDCLFYIGCLVITFNIFPFKQYGLGSSKCLAIIPLLFYVLQSILNTTFILPAKYTAEFLLIIVLLFISFLKCGFVYGDTMGFSNSISMWLSYIIFVVAFETFLQRLTIRKTLLLFKCLFVSFKISLIFGLLELVYFYILKSNLIKNFIILFIRDDMYLPIKRVQFNFGEPGEAGFLISGLLSMVIFTLHRLNYKFSLFEIFEIIILYIIVGGFSHSMSFWLVFGVLLISFSLSLLFEKRSSKKALLMLVLSIFCFTLIAYINVIDQQSMDRIKYFNYENRNNMASDDNSTTTRIALWGISYDIFKDNFISGIGWGNFSEEYPQYVNRLPLYLQSHEITSKRFQKSLQTYSIYTTAMAEGGLIGILWLIIVISRLKFRTKMQRIWGPVFLFICLQIIFIYKFEYTLMLLVLSSPRLQSIIENNCNYYKNHLYGSEL